LKYMVSIRCRMIAKNELESLAIPHRNIEAGMIVIPSRLTASQDKLLRARLFKMGIEMLSRESSEIIEQIVRSVDEMINGPSLRSVKHEDAFIANRSKSEVDFWSELFAEVKGISIKQYILSQKIESVKVHLLYSDKKVKELSSQFNFRSVESLRNEFKKFTGLTPSFYRQLKSKRGEGIEHRPKDESGPTKMSAS